MSSVFSSARLTASRAACSSIRALLVLQLVQLGGAGLALELGFLTIPLSAGRFLPLTLEGLLGAGKALPRATETRTGNVELFAEAQKVRIRSVALSGFEGDLIVDLGELALDLRIPASGPLSLIRKLQMIELHLVATLAQRLELLARVLDLLSIRAQRLVHRVALGPLTGEQSFLIASIRRADARFPAVG